MAIVPRKEKLRVRSVFAPDTTAPPAQEGVAAERLQKPVKSILQDVKECTFVSIYVSTYLNYTDSIKFLWQYVLICSHACLGVYIIISINTSLRTRVYSNMH